MELNGSDYRKNVKKLLKENKLLALANAPDTRVDTLAKALPEPSDESKDDENEDQDSETAEVIRLDTKRKP
jgi:hypothetical protein